MAAIKTHALTGLFMFKDVFTPKPPTTVEKNMDATTFKSFLDLTKSIHDSAKQQIDVNNSMMQARINTMEIKNEQLKSFLTAEKDAHEAVKSSLASHQGEIKVLKSALEASSKNNQKHLFEVRQLKEKFWTSETR